MAAPTLVQHVCTSSQRNLEAGQNFVVWLNQPTLARNCLVFGIHYQQSAGRTITITDSVGGNTYSSLASVSDRLECNGCRVQS